MTAPADFVSLSSKGNIVAGTPAQTKSCLAFNASSDPNSVYTEMVLDAVYASYFKLLLSGLYQRIETNSKFILFFGVGSAQPCFRAIAIPSGVIAQPTGKTLFPFVFSANGYLGTNTISQGFSLTSRKISDGLFIHSCCLCGLTAWMSSGNYYLYHTVFFSYTEDKNTGTLTFYNMSTYSADLTLSSGNFSVKIQNAYVRAGTLYIYFSYTNNTDSFIKVIQWALDGTGQPTESTVDVMASVANAWYTVNSIGDKIVYQRTIGGNYISIDKNGTVISFGLLATSDINTFLFSIGEDSFIYNVWYTSSGNQNVVKISYDGGATFQRIFSGGATTLLAFSGAVTFFNGYYWGVPYSGSLLYRARKFSDLTSGAVPSVFANVPTGQMEVIADGNLLAIFSSAGMPATAPSQACGNLRKVLCFSRSSESSDIPIPMAPAAFSFCAISSVISVPLVPKTERKPRLVACATSSRISGRISGSPPLKIIILKPALAISSSSFFASTVLSSSSALQPASR